MTRTLEELREYLVGEWLFQNDFRDTSGNDNHGVPIDVEWKPTERGMKPYSNNGEVSAPFQTQELSEFTIHINHKSPWTHFKGVFWCEDDSQQDGFHLTTYNSGSSMRYKLHLFKDGVHDQIWFSVPYNDVDITKFRTFDIVFKNGSIKHYLNGQFIGEQTSNFNSITTHNEAVIGFVDSYNTDTRFYSTALTDDEVLALYNSTKHAYGVTPAERSFSHDVGSVLGTGENTVFATDMHTKNADGTLVDLSGNNNHGTINGAVRAGGYFKNGMSFNKTSLNNISIPSEAFKFGQNDIIVEILFNSVFDGIGSIFNTGATSSSAVVEGIWIYGVDTTINTIIQSSVGGTRISSGFNVFVPNKLTHMLVHFDRDDKCYLYLNGVKYPGMDITSENGDVGVERPPTIGAYSSYGFDGDIYAVNVNTSLNYDLIDRFNKLAVLPLYSLDFSKHPSNTTVYDDFLPYSSARITSGSFKVNDDKLECVTDGQIVFRNAHEFDGSEYIKLTIDGTVYAGTGTITQGTVTASISQDSTAITVNMAAGDVLDKLDIQFRKPVDD
jgi:hypothetical protein